MTQPFPKFLSLLKSHHSSTRILPVNSGAQSCQSGLCVELVKWGGKCIQRFCGGNSSVGSTRAERKQVRSSFAPPPPRGYLANFSAQFWNDWSKAAPGRWSGREWLKLGKACSGQRFGVGTDRERQSLAKGGGHQAMDFHKSQAEKRRFDAVRTISSSRGGGKTGWE